MSYVGATSFWSFQAANDKKSELMYRGALRIAKTTSNIILAGMLSNIMVNMELTWIR